MSAQTSSVLRIIIFLFLLAAPDAAFQMPPQPGKLDITSTTKGLKISINGHPRPEVTPVVLVVSPGAYNVVVGPCPVQYVQVASGETKPVNCPQ
jgi:hypothetical protein